MNELLGDKSKYQKQLQQNIASVIRVSAAITTDGVDEKLMELQQELVKKANNKEAYDEIADQIFALRESASKLQWTQYSVMNSYSESQNYKISSKTNLPTLQYLMKHL